MTSFTIAIMFSGLSILLNSRILRINASYTHIESNSLNFFKKSAHAISLPFVQEILWYLEPTEVSIAIYIILASVGPRWFYSILVLTKSEWGISVINLQIDHGSCMSCHIQSLISLWIFSEIVGKCNSSYCSWAASVFRRLNNCMKASIGKVNGLIMINESVVNIFSFFIDKEVIIGL